MTVARAAITKRKAETGERLSFTGWVINCLAQAASEHKRVHALRLGRHKLVLFDEVDVNIVVQRRLEGSEPPEYLPMPYVIRKASENTVEKYRDTAEHDLDMLHRIWESGFGFGIAFMNELYICRHLPTQARRELAMCVSLADATLTEQVIRERE